ncbi:hypothetical protein L7F22_028100 [Adiantum nelumboides]|nr:hypothetical protein [Adiantum nelumboides]
MAVMVVGHVNIAFYTFLLNGAIFMNKGEFVSDDLVVGNIKTAIKKPSCQREFILDDFPQTMAQVKKLHSILENQGTKVDNVLNFEIANSTLEEKIRGCWIHPASGRSYHKTCPPPKALRKDDITREPLIRQKDDIVEVLKSQLEAFHKQTKSVVDYYKEKGIVVALHAETSPKELLL